MQTQAVLFDVNKWSAKKAKLWLQKHSLSPMKKVHKTDQYLRYRIHDPAKYAHFITKTLPNGIVLIIGGF